MRSVVYRFDELRQLGDAIDGATGQALRTPPAASVRDGEWVLAMFEIGLSGRATAAAARGVLLDDGAALVFERRDWERLRHFAAAQPSDSSLRVPAATAAELPGIDIEIETGEASVREPRPIPQAPPPVPLRGRTAAYETVRLPPSPAPVEPAHAAASSAAPEPSVSRPGAPGPARVLLVDDDADLQDVVIAMLEVVGLSVEAVETAEEALDRLGASPPDLLVLDWSLPGMSGLELCRRLRRDRSHGALPILFLTAHAGTQDMVEAFAAGADDYVVKPFRAAELGARIFGLLRRARVAPARERA